MAFKLVKRNKLRVPIKGTLADEDGKPVNFSFVLICERLSQSAIEEAIKSKDETVKDFVKRVTTGWEDMLDASGEALSFEDQNLDAVLEEAGMPSVCYQAYLNAVGAVAKN